MSEGQINASDYLRSNKDKQLHLIADMIDNMVKRILELQKYKDQNYTLLSVLKEKEKHIETLEKERVWSKVAREALEEISKEVIKDTTPIDLVAKYDFIASKALEYDPREEK